MDHDISNVDVLIRFLAAVVCGAVVGWEREAKDKPAGLKTNMMVALGACGFTVISAAVLGRAAHEGVAMQADPLRTIHGIAVGVGFLGAGAILHGEHKVKGLTTAAGIWVAAAMGVAMGLGQFVIGGALLGFAIVILRGARMFEDHERKA
ncbi:MAG: MgtC/SapB family protein [Phycisphaerales bacterium]|nr:MgtC/SapB family protein [Phycisphaerales bacterium]